MQMMPLLASTCTLIQIISIGLLSTAINILQVAEEDQVSEHNTMLRNVGQPVYLEDVPKILMLIIFVLQ